MPSRRLARMTAAAMTLPAMLLAACGQTTQQSYTLDMPAGHAPLAVDVKNFRGSVELRAIPNRNDIRVRGDIHVTEETAYEARTPIEQGVSISAAVEDSEGGAVLRVRSESQYADQHNHWVRLIIEAPYVDGVRIDNRGPMEGMFFDSDVEVVGTRGAAEITNRKGAIEFRSNTPITDPVTLTTVDGNIYYQVAPGSTGKLDLETLDGEVIVKDFTAATDETYSSQTLFQSTLGDGHNPVTARTNVGDIYMWVRDNPVALTRVWKRSVPDPRDAMFLQGSRRYTRNLPEDTPRNVDLTRNYYNER